ncbi:MAG: YajQ family cyclic di-GMP-binding protein [Elusimicrobia bacterium]|nr:YajQ family cyclic di-GMP-binding protein [Elusimicrobiota bacterium]
MSEFSFDVVSKVDLQAVDDAINIAMKEIQNRFDFKGSVSSINLDKKTGEMTITSDDDNRLKVVHDIIKTKFIKRGVSLKNLDLGKIEPAENSSVRQKAKIIQGIATEKAKAITAAIKASGRKVNPSIMGDHVRVFSKSKDELQATMGLLRANDYGVELTFENYR